MNSQFKIKLLQNLSKNKVNKGFTLIELLVVVIIIGVLAAIALPNLLGQVAKGRQAEAKNNLGAINRGQQAYRSEKGVFVPLTNTSLGVKITGQYYSYAPATVVTTGNSTYGSFSASSISNYINDIRNYASAVNQDTNGTFVSIICESLGTANSGSGAVAASGGNATTATLNCGTFNTVN